MKPIVAGVASVVGMAAILAVVAGFHAAQRTLLVARSVIVVDSYPVPDRNKFQSPGTLKLGQRVQVLSCDQLKSYPAVHVRLDNGAEGYVIDGKYELKEYSPWSNVNSPTTFSCSDD